MRSIGIFGSVREGARAGARVALNLPGVDRHQIARGAAVVGREFAADRSFAVRFTPLTTAVPLLRRRTPVRAYVGSAEILGTLVLPAVPAPGQESRALLHLREPVVAFAGVRFVLRRPSPMTLLGGGYVEGMGGHSHRAEDAPDEAAVAQVLRERAGEALEPAALAASANLREGAAALALGALVERGDAIALARPRAFVDGNEARALLARALAQLERAHRDEPWAMGLTSIALARALGVDENLLVRVLAHFVEEGRLLNRGGYYAALDFSPSLTPEQRAFFDHLVPLDEGQPFVPIPFPVVASAVKLTQLRGVQRAFDTMLAQGTLVKVGDDLYRGAQIGRIKARVELHLGENARMTAAEFRDLLGTSRKYAVPLLEWLDAHGVTLRDGDYRTLRKVTRIA